MRGRDDDEDNENAQNVAPEAGRWCTFVNLEDVDGYNNTYNGHPYNGHPVPYDKRDIASDVKDMYDLAKAGNVTTFHPRERKHPIHFWEQRVNASHKRTAARHRSARAAATVP